MITISQYGGSASASMMSPSGSCQSGLGISYVSYGSTTRVAKDNGCIETTSNGGERFVSCTSGINTWPSICTDYGVTDRTHEVTCTFVFYNKNDPNPPCSQFLPVAAPSCKGGQGIQFIDGHTNGTGKLYSMYGNSSVENNYGGSYSWEWVTGQSALAQLAPFPHDTTNNTTNRPDGSTCSLYDGGGGMLLLFTICPNGFADDYSSSSAFSSNSQSSSSDGVSSDSGMSSDSGGCSIKVKNDDGTWSCMDKPVQPCEVMVNGVCMDDSWKDCKVMVDGECWEYHDKGGGDGSGGGGSGSSGSGLGCENLHNCDWAKLDVQLAQLGVETAVRDAIRLMGNDVREGKNLSAEQLRVLNAILGALGSGSGSSGSGGGGSSGSGQWPSGTCDPRVSDCTYNVGGSDADTSWGVTASFFNSAVAGLGLDTGSIRSRISQSILSDTSKVFPGMRRAITPFNDYIRRSSNGCSTTLDFSFQIAGFSCGALCRVNMSQFGGKNIGNLMSDFMTIAFGLAVIVRLLFVIRTFGQMGR
jgi:hypothetical protein